MKFGECWLANLTLKSLNLLINTGAGGKRSVGPALEGGNVMCLLQALFIFSTWITIISGQQYCHDSTDCAIRLGTSCQNSECFHPPPGSKFRTKCVTDTDCDIELICDKGSGFCHCRSGSIWDNNSLRCILLTDDGPYPNKKTADLYKDLFILCGIMTVVSVIGTICYKILCPRKSWRRRRRGNDLARALEEVQIPYAGTSQPTWIASYRVFGTVERSGPPCLLLPVGPPTYEEALKHKVILSSNHPPSITVIETTPL